ncbi:hypothetical protein ABVK25_011076 [Lepraria finkii]|uniref:Cytochrome P450 n=1 Tax=Lepraria finkii TaxID=1340010 RepID=A0ABR4AR94_9LECA
MPLSDPKIKSSSKHTDNFCSFLSPQAPTLPPPPSPAPSSTSSTIPPPSKLSPTTSTPPSPPSNPSAPVPSLSQSRYLKACIDEAMRISPGVPGLLPREVQPPGLSINNIHIPTGTDVGVPHYAIHHNEAYYPDSWSYRPERWIVDATTGVSEEDVVRAQSAFCPFSIGPRGCVGKALAMKEIMVVVGRLVWGV